MASNIFCKLFFPDALYHHHECPDKDNDIEKERVVLDIVTIEKYLVFERIFFSAVDLCHARRVTYLTSVRSTIVGAHPERVAL